jgi:FemAB-related protein (PEP-CTERM system-associated)
MSLYGNNINVVPCPGANEPARTVTTNIGRREASDVSVITCTDDDLGVWNEFIRACPTASFYHMFQWSFVNREQLRARPLYLAAVERGQILGVLPLILVSSRLFGRILCSMPFVNFGGPCASDAAIQHLLARAAIVKANELAVDYLELRCTRPLELDLPVSLQKVSMTIELAADPDVLWNGYTSKHRKNVKRAYKNDLAVEAGGPELVPIFYSVLEESWHNLGTPLYARSYFDSVMRALPDNTRIFVCRRAAEPVAVAMTGYFNGVVEGLWAGGRAVARELDANYVLYWEMIRDACHRGYRTFHLGRSTADSGSEEFKRRWNAEASQLYWYFHNRHGAHTPQLNVNNPRYRAAIAAWKRSPRWLVRALGPMIARAIP